MCEKKSGAEGQTQAGSGRNISDSSNENCDPATVAMLLSLPISW
jgi:hypothetical protein